MKALAKLLPHQHDKTLFYWAMLASFIIVALRVFVADYQIDWDEELYFQIAKGWSDGLVPYRDIFDHKPPLLYVYYSLFSGFGSSFALLRILQALLLLYALMYTWNHFRERLSILFVPAMLALFSAKGLTGTNSELIYIPFILFTFVFLLRGQWLAASLAAALVVGVKYTAALDILGVAVTVWLMQKRWQPVLLFAVVSASVFLLVHALLYMYFNGYGVDVLYETILRNLQHSGGERNLLKVPSKFWTLLVVLTLLCGVRIKEGRPDIDVRFTAGLLIWAVLSFVQSQITGRGYYHYFIPIFIPLCLLTFSFIHDLSVTKTRVIGYSVCIGVMLYALSLGNMYYQKHKSDSSRLSAACELDTFHYDGKSLFIYRLCDVQPLKYMFPQFYKSEHFEKVSGSGGLQWLNTVERPVVSDDGKTVQIFPDGLRFAEHYKEQIAAETLTSGR